MQSEALGMCVWEGFTRIDLLAYMRSAKKPQSFLQTLGSVRGRRCHDERDKVYGMLGLASGEWEGFVEVDYSKETEEVYRDVATAAAQRTGRLDFLSFCYGARGEGVKVPSFVPDWTASIDGVGHAAYLSRTFSISNFNAAHGVKAEWRLIEPEVAVFKGVAFDRVTVIGETQKEDSITTAEILDSWLRVAKVGNVDFSSDEWDTRRVAEGSDELPDAEKRIWVFGQLMCGDVGCDWDEGNLFTRRADAIKDLPKYRKWHTWIAGGRTSEDFDADVGYFDNAHMATVRDRRFIVTEKGFLGFAPISVTEGDVVAILAGGSVPYVLRRQSGVDGASDGYTLVGDAYVQGVMDGELLTRYKMEFGQITLF
ncbi:hypothetical protein NUW58_g7739 [Xylaria curta]|uniref:Uncharacterized protein n=1 Tax=Xylaria curta TaxID=42375 RepID=A0ACC1NF60_9PEZI|nr:hypothetical protein NUW58_g7739 [Xylaria curta]